MRILGPGGPKLEFKLGLGKLNYNFIGYFQAFHLNFANRGQSI